MSKILKNATISDIEINSIGLTIPASGQITIPVEDYLLLGSEDSIAELTTLINNGDVVVNDGSIDLFTAKGIEYIKYQDNFINGNTVYISPAGSNTTGDGSFNNPFADLTGVETNLNNGNITTPSSSNPLTIECDAGNYTQAPVDFSAYNNLNIFGKSLRTRITASNGNANLLTMGIDSGIKGISLTGVTNANNWHLIVTATAGGGFSTSDVSVINGSNGIKFENSSGNIAASCFTTLSIGLTGTIFETNDNVTLTVSAISAIGNGTTTIGFVQNGTGTLFVLTARITNLGIGVQTNGSGTTQLISLTEVNSNNVLDQNGTGLIEVLGGNFDVTTASVTNTSKVEGYFLNELPEEFQLRIISELSVGLPNRGRESVFGEGDSYTLGMLVYTYDGTSYSSVTTSANSFSGSTFTFPNNNVGSAIYITTAFDQASPLDWFGFKVIYTTAAVLGSGDIVFEYYNGSSWVEVNHMIVQSNTPYEQFANSKFEVAPDTYQVLLDTRIEGQMVANDNPGVGLNLKWLRLRIDTASITTAPVFEQFKIHTNRFELESNGFQNMYGKGRIIEKFPITFTGFAEFPGKGPNSQDVYLSDNISVGLKFNSFPSNQDRSASFTQMIPYELDTSCPITLTIKYYASTNTSGNVAFELRWATSLPGEGMFPTAAAAPTTATNERSISGLEAIASSTRYQEKIFSAQLEVPEALVQEDDGNPKSQLWLVLTRQATSVSDTYGGDVVVTDLAVFYTAYREGGYSGNF